MLILRKSICVTERQATQAATIFFLRNTNFAWKNNWQENHSYLNLVIWQDIFSKMNQENLSFQEKL